jgi:signal transduction histidine kinase
MDQVNAKRARGAAETWELCENDAVPLPNGGEGTVVRVHHGTVLVTQEGDLDDHVLETGDELLLRRRGRAVAWALTGASLSVRASGGRSLRLASPAGTAPDRGRDVYAKFAHELRNPLTAVKALVQLGLRDPAESAAHARLGVVEKELARMQEILERYLSSTRALEEVRPSPTALGPLVEETLRVLAGKASDARVRLASRGDATVEADPRRLQEALLNLLSNAIEATPPGGEVTVEVRPSGGHAEIAVRDTGRGMAPETLRRLGTPFFTTRRDGTGLGVNLARSVIALHGGTLRYESAPGKGTTVRAILPTRARAA